MSELDTHIAANVADLYDAITAALRAGPDYEIARAQFLTGPADPAVGRLLDRAVGPPARRAAHVAAAEGVAET